MKKVVRLTKSELSEIIKRTLSEKQGVPNNIYESAERMYEDFLSKLKSIPSDSTQEEFDFDLYGSYQISDYYFDGADFKFQILTHTSPEYGIEFLGAGVQQKSKIHNWKIKIHPNYGLLRMDMRLAAPEGWNLGDVVKHIESKRPKYISNFAHEMKHAYDDSVKTSASIESRTEYVTFQNLKLGKIKPINDFLHNSYFIHEIEEGVRASELYSLLRSSNITKSQFKTFFYDTEMIQKFKQIRDFKLTDLIQQLHGYMPDINKILEDIMKANPDMEKIPSDSSDDEKIKYLLNVFYQLLASHKIESYINYLGQIVNPLSIMFGSVDVDEANKITNSYIEKVQKYQNYKKFFVNEEKRFNFVGERMIKRLARLYDMVNHDANSSIGNWDLHQKINKAGEKTLKEIKKLSRDGKLKLTTGNVYDKKKPTS